MKKLFLFLLLLLFFASSAWIGYNIPDFFKATDMLPSETEFQDKVDLNTSSFDTVKVAQQNQYFKTKRKLNGQHIFTNKVNGFSIAVPKNLKITDLGDATYRTVFSNENTRIEIFTHQHLEDPATITDYSNRFINNHHDFTLENQLTIDHSKFQIHQITFKRVPLKKLNVDRRYYSYIDIYDPDTKKAYSIQISSTEPIEQQIDTVALIDSFEVFSPQQEASEYPRGKNERTDLTTETKDFYNSYFVNSQKLRWGIFDATTGNNNLTDFTKLQSIETELDYHFDILLHYTNLHKKYKTSQIYDILQAAYKENRIVELSLQTPLYDVEKSNNMVFSVLNGEYDDYLHDYARDIARFGHPVLFRPFNEMNGDWCTYSALWSGRDCSIYVELYRYIYDIFKEENATANTLWIWNPNEKSFPNQSWNYADNYYPGDEYVDIIGLTGYNTGTYYSSEKWRSFSSIYDPIYKEMSTQYHQPYMITEFACSSIGGDKAKWVTDMFSKFDQYPNIKVAVWWNGYDLDPKDKTTISRPYFIDDSPEVMSAFKNHFAK